MSYPWIKDSQYLTSPVTGYLAVTSTNGLYLNFTNSKVLLKSPTTNEALTISKSALDFTNASGNSVVLIDNTHIHLNEQTPTTTPFTTDITNQNIILQSQNYIPTTTTTTLTLQPNLIQQLNPDFSMIMGTGSLQTQSLLVARTSTFNPYVCNIGFDGSTYQGELNCLNINCANNLQVSTINGLTPTSIGLVWSDFNNAYPNLLNGRYYLTDTTFETYQDTQQFYARNMSSTQLASYNWNGINTQNGTFTLQTNGYNFDLYCSTFYINGSPYSPGGGGGVTDIQAGSGISVNQNTGSVTITNTGGGGGGVTDIQAGPGISVNQTTGSVTITNTGGGGGSQDLATTLSYGNYANTTLNMNGNSIDNVTTINGSSYPPSISIPQTAYAMPFQYSSINSGSQTVFSSGVYITGGFTYAITWTFWYDSLFQNGGDKQMIQGYGDLYSNSYGSIQGDAKANGLWASSYVSTDSMYRTTITYTDNNYVINNSDTYYPYIYQLNTNSWSGNVYCSATISRTN